MTKDKVKNELDEILNKELTLDELDEVSGGRIKLSGYALLTALIVQMKILEKDKEYCIEALKNGWQQDCEFKTRFTDETNDDLQQAIAFIEKNW